LITAPQHHLSIEVLIDEETDHGTLSALFSTSDQNGSLDLYQLFQVLAVYHAHLLGLDYVPTHAQALAWLLL
jgi:hypothetical protein